MTSPVLKTTYGALLSLMCAGGLACDLTERDFGARVPATGGQAGESGSGGAMTGSGGSGGGAAGDPGSGGSGTGGAGEPEGPVYGPSCDGMNGEECNGESCCETIALSGGAFMMGRSANGNDQGTGDSDEQPEHEVTLSPYSLDKYEVTVGRFRRFADAFDAWRAEDHPLEGEGAHPLIAGSGWQPAWDERLTRLPVSRSDLLEMDNCGDSDKTWTDEPGDNETLPIACVNWYTAFAFCAWDGGRLPTEAEWEFAAAGGSQNRRYPWGSAVPGTNTDLAAYGCHDECFVLPVGSIPAGAGRWGHMDLGGNLREWVLDYYLSDWYSNAAASGTDVAQLDGPAGSVSWITRGGDYYYGVGLLRAADRSGALPDESWTTGIRCAR